MKVSRWRQTLQQNGPEGFADQRDPKSGAKAQLKGTQYQPSVTGPLTPRLGTKQPPENEENPH